MSFDLIDKKMMLRCIQLAKKGLGNTYPNPLVGSVITHNNKIIGEGWHQKAGLPHAEINAIESVENKELLSQSTLYVNLEPCSHFGKTPPCADAIIKYNIPKVVIGHIDLSSKVNGKGIEKLQNHGIEVKSNCLPLETYEINKRFFTFHQKKRPFIILKWAETSDGFMGKKDEQIWISNPKAKQVVHQLRTQEQAILVGKNTVLTDNPKLNARAFYGKNPIRIVLDRKLDIPSYFFVLDNSVKTLIINEKIEKTESNNYYIKLNLEDKNWTKKIIDELYKYEIQSVIIEGGSYTLTQFIENNLWDEANIFVAWDRKMETGIKSPELKNHQLVYSKSMDNNLLNHYINQNREQLHGLNPLDIERVCPFLNS